MVSVEKAAKIILEQTRNYGTEEILFDESIGRVLTENIYADRDMPPFNRVTMDGIAINFEAFKEGTRSFYIKSIQSAGEKPNEIENGNDCVEIMTGAALPSTTDTVIPYEEIEIQNGVAILKSENIFKGQNIHQQGKDKKQYEILVGLNQLINPAIITIAASVGKKKLLVRKNPKIIIISTGDELVEVDETPTAFQIRRSNNYTLQSVLKQHCLKADMMHLPDNPQIISEKLKNCIEQYDVIILSGGVSMGKFDYVPEALEKLEVKKLFHKVQQRPGKPFWFGFHEKGTLIFAFPGNPVSGFMCLHRYFLPWYKKSMQIKTNSTSAILNEDFVFKPSLQYFLQVRLSTNEKCELLATPVEGHGSGDFINLLQTDAFLELPLEKTEFKKGEIYPVWIFKQTI